jgi:hypothetical protein
VKFKTNNGYLNQEEVMKRTVLIAVLALAITGAGYGLASAHSGSGWGHMGADYGHMGNQGNMMGYDSRTYGADQGYCGTTATEAKVNLTEKDAKELIAYRFTQNNPNLEVGKVKGTEDGFEVQVVTKKGNALVDRLLVEKDTGRIYRVYE